MKRDKKVGEFHTNNIFMSVYFCLKFKKFILRNGNIFLGVSFLTNTYIYKQQVFFLSASYMLIAIMRKTFYSSSYTFECVCLCANKKEHTSSSLLFLVFLLHCFEYKLLSLIFSAIIRIRRCHQRLYVIVVVFVVVEVRLHTHTHMHTW